HCSLLSHVRRVWPEISAARRFPPLTPYRVIAHECAPSSAGTPQRLPVPGQGRRERMAEESPSARTPGAVITWLTWWILLMSLWVAVDDSVAPDELLAGAGAAALAALAAAGVSRQARIRYRIRTAWLPRALALPGQVVSDTLAVFAVLARTIATKAPPPHG